MKTKKATKAQPEKNLPTMSKQTAGGIGGAAIGGLLGGPVGAVVGGVAGALVGNASARGKKPIKNAVEAVRSTLRSSKTAKAVGAKVDKKLSSAVTGKASKTKAKATAAKSTAKTAKSTKAAAPSAKKPAAKKAASPKAAKKKK